MLNVFIYFHICQLTDQCKMTVKIIIIGYIYNMIVQFCINQLRLDINAVQQFILYMCTLIAALCHKVLQYHKR